MCTRKKILKIKKMMERIFSTRHGSLRSSPQGRANATRKRLDESSSRSRGRRRGRVTFRCAPTSPGRRRRVVTWTRNKYRLRSEIGYPIFFFLIPPFFVSSAISVRTGWKVARFVSARGKLLESAARRACDQPGRGGRREFHPGLPTKF